MHGQRLKSASLAEVVLVVGTTQARVNCLLNEEHFGLLPIETLEHKPVQTSGLFLHQPRESSSLIGQEIQILQMPKPNSSQANEYKKLRHAHDEKRNS